MPMVVVAVRSALVASALVLAGCTTNETNEMMAPPSASAPPPDAASAAAVSNCPQVTLRAGTGSMTRNVGQGRVTAEITEVQSRCTASGGQVTVEIAVRGRVTAEGAAAGAGEIAVPIRVAALSGQRLAYSKLGRQGASAGGGGAGTFSYVDTGLRVPASEAAGLEIFAGIDEMG